jgi:soluble lytic murein transglycosylase-like protein
MLKRILFSAFAVALFPISIAQADQNYLTILIAQHAAANNVPEALVHRIVRRESNYNARAVGRGGALGLMQIKYATARGMGYTGAPSGLLDANTNLTYAVRYLAGAYRVAGGNHDRSVSYYASGYYYAAKRQGLTPAVPRTPRDVDTTGAIVQEAAAVAPTFGPVPDWASMR